MAEGSSVAITTAIIGAVVALLVAFGRAARARWMTFSVGRRAVITSFGGAAVGALIVILTVTPADESFVVFTVLSICALTFAAFVTFLIDFPPQSN